MAQKNCGLLFCDSNTRSSARPDVSINFGATIWTYCARGAGRFGGLRHVRAGGTMRVTRKLRRDNGAARARQSRAPEGAAERPENREIPRDFRRFRRQATARNCCVILRFCRAGTTFSGARTRPFQTAANVRATTGRRAKCSGKSGLYCVFVRLMCRRIVASRWRWPPFLRRSTIPTIR
jgi:hypothetical protein